MHDGEVLLVPQRLKSRHRRMQTEESIEIKHRFARNVDGRPHRVVRQLTVRDDDVQSISGAALENDDQPFRFCARLSRSIRGTCKKTRERGGSYRGECAVEKKYSTGDGHKWQSAIGLQLKNTES